MTQMSAADRMRRDREMIPRRLLRAMFGLVFVCLMLVTYARITDRPLEALPPQDMAIVAERSVLIEGSMSGAARVLDMNGTLIADFDATKGGFVAGMWRVLNRERAKRDVPLDGPVRIVAWEDGRLSLLDDTTGWRAELTGFGADNLAVFRRLLD